MRKFVLTALSLAFLAGSAYADDYYFIQQKREEAERNRAMLLEQIQHKQANPNEFLAKLQDNSQVKTASFPVSSNGHYYVNALMNGRSINFIADTGASSIFLTGDDARRIGLDIQNLN